MCWNANMFICKECLNIALLLFPTVIFDFSFFFFSHVLLLSFLFFASNKFVIDLFKNWTGCEMKHGLELSFLNLKCLKPYTKLVGFYQDYKYFI